MRATIAERARQGVAVILSSHLLQLVEELCTSLLVIRRGRMVARGSVASIVQERPELAALGLEDLFLTLTGGDRERRAIPLTRVRSASSSCPRCATGWPGHSRRCALPLGPAPRRG